MNNNSSLPERFAAQKPDELYRNRSFRDMGTGISGRSVVIEEERSSSERHEADNIWPYSLTDYLKGFIGSMVLVEYLLPNCGCSKKRGKLKVVGTNFIGIQTYRYDSLSLLEIGTVKSIEILDCENTLPRPY
ncbi:MAG: hypothetical protein CVU91_13100 [Firmicutes bacterium HGW-Firmicutes-16]|nr:MAG: hypothetical protein CVU91_13100 [Firmicutes bacterium HGW-Firmicutes-16]